MILIRSTRTLPPRAMIAAQRAVHSRSTAARKISSARSGATRQTVHHRPAAAPPAAGTLPVAGLCLLLALLTAGCGAAGGKAEIPVFDVKRGEFRISVTESGELRAQNSTVITAPRTRFGSLQIVDIVPEGTQVVAGDVVIEFDTTEPMKRIIEKEAELEINQADLRKMKTDQVSRMNDLRNQLTNKRASLEMAELRQERMRYESESQRREAELQVTQAQLDVEQTEEKLETQKIIDAEEIHKLELKIQQVSSELNMARADLDKLKVRAPAPGLVVYQRNWATDAKVQVGDTPWPSMPLMELPDLSRMMARTQINEVDVSKVAMDQEVIVTLDAFPDRSFPGKVSSVATLATEKERRSNVKVFDVEALLDDTDPIMKPGMTVKVEVVVERLPDVITVPLEAVFEREGEMVSFVKRNGSFSRRPVTLGERNEDFVVVMDGLQEGEKVALRDPDQPLEAIGLPEEPAASAEDKEGA